VTQAGALQVDFARAVSLAIPLALDGPQPRHFGAPPATSRPYVAGSFNGEVSRGASCNCRSVTLVPHCNGTHTEGVAHLTTGGQPLYQYVPQAPLPALVLSLAPVRTGDTPEDSLPAPQAGDQLLTWAAIEAAWPATLPVVPRVLVLRTLPNGTDKQRADHSNANPPYLTRQAAAGIAARGIEHLVLDLPSADRSDDGGSLTAHRLFFGLPAGSTAHDDATRGHCTITEFAFIPDDVPDGPCALQLQLLPWSGDAVPSRPLYLPLVNP
jgi:kynurenine formamidase